MVLRACGLGIIVAAGFAATHPVLAQQATENIPQNQRVEASSFLTLDQERLYQQSDFGNRVVAMLKAEAVALSEENRTIDEALTEEEKRLTNERAGMEPADFRRLAIDFDERVTAIRQAQSLKQAAIQQQGDQERARFFELAFPVLLALVEETGAVAILNTGAVIFSVRNVDITNVAIARVNAVIGEAAPDPTPGLQPVPRPDVIP